MSIFEVHPEIQRARTLSADFYTHPEYFQASKEKIFAHSWQFLCHADEISNLKPVSLLPSILDERLLLARSGDEIRCLSNVCTHRGKMLIENECEANLIRCGYHGRRFSLDGRFLSMPEFEGVVDFPAESDHLRPVPMAVRQGFVFASLDPVVGFDEMVNDVAARFSEDDYDGLRLAARTEYEVNAHWALYCENYLEGFHIPYVHKGLNAVVDYGSYTTELFRYSSLQTGRDDQGKIIARYLFLFPNLMFNFYPWGISVNIVRPIACDKSVVEFLTYVGDDSLIDGSAGADLHTVELEDEAVVESVQKGIRSRFYSHGRYSPTREQGTHHFHRLIVEFMNA